MKIFETLTVVKLQPGEIQLDDEQARRRKAQVRKTLKKGVYQPIAMLTFKAGEKIGLNGDFLTKRELQNFKPVGGDVEPVIEEKTEIKPEPVKPVAKKTTRKTKK